MALRAAFLAVGAICLTLCPPAQAHGLTVTARVLACYDGDTCTVDRDILPGRDRVRLRNADTPEIKGKCRAERELAQRARDFSQQLVGQAVTLEDVKVDKYARRVDAYVVMPDGSDLGLGLALIAAGLARPYSGGKRAGWCGA
jgi:micrococcal nuclease